MTVRDYRISLGWSVSELSRRSGLAIKTINRIEDGQPVYDYTLGAVARAFSEALGRTVTIDDFEGAKIIRS
jgi:transcriptional regulator with XRE-family HTH domain